MNALWLVESNAAVLTALSVVVNEEPVAQSG